MAFTHLHVHSHFSILDGMSKIQDLLDKCIKNKMYAMALTDHGNMFGIKELLDKTNGINSKLKEKRNGLKEQLAAIEDGSLEKQTIEKIAALEEQLKEADKKKKEAIEEAFASKPKTIPLNLEAFNKRKELA